MYTNEAKWDPYTWPKIAFYLGLFHPYKWSSFTLLVTAVTGPTLYLHTHVFSQKKTSGKYMAQSPKGRLIQGLYKPIHGNCAIYFYPGVFHW